MICVPIADPDHQLCEPDHLRFECAPGQICLIDPAGVLPVGRCTDPPNLPIGDPCFANNQCASFYCDRTTHTCGRAADGEFCSAGRSCASGVCINSHCVGNGGGGVN
jgi:hypothetical protein